MWLSLKVKVSGRPFLLGSCPCGAACFCFHEVEIHSLMETDEMGAGYVWLHVTGNPAQTESNDESIYELTQ